MTERKIRNIVIVGGGTAGWLTAAKIAKQHSSECIVVLIESPDIPTIGVGEGTWPTMRKTLMQLGIDEADFMRSCSATFKQGTEFVNWGKESGHRYYHLFSSIFDPSDFNLAPYWQNGAAGPELDYADAVSAQAELCRNGLAPKRITTKAFDGEFSYAYHLDAGAFAHYLKKYCIETLGVKFISANVRTVNLTEVGDIASVALDTGKNVEGEFFVDCTGFKSLLLGDALGVPFHSISDTLLTDSAIALQVPYLERQDIPCATISTAQTAGWIWEISLEQRRGIGHVYSSTHMSADEAESIVRAYAGVEGKNVNAKHIKMPLGYRKVFWQKNCVAVGLSAAFVEPLEASAIFLIEAAGNMIAELLPQHPEDMPFVARCFNESFHYRWQKTIEFIKMHYVLSQRHSPFWAANKRAETIPRELQEKLSYWKNNPISRYQFAHVFEPFPHESYQYVYYGMTSDERKQSSENPLVWQSKAAAMFATIQRIKSQVHTTLPKHRELIDKVYKYGFQSI